MNNIIYCWNNISPIDDIQFVDEMPENLNIEDQANLLLALLAGHVSGLVFKRVAEKIGVDNNKLIGICDKAYNEAFEV